MGAGVVTISGRKYAAGLFWQPSPSKAVAKSAREAAMQPGQEADFFSVRPATKSGRVPQFGLGLLRAGHKMGMPSVACSLGNAVLGSWAGAFKVPEGVVVVTVRDDLITPDGDEFYTDEAEAMAKLEQDIALGGLDRIFAPANWNIPNSDESPITFVIGGRADGKLKPIKVPRRLVAITVVAAVVIGGIIYAGLSIYQDMQAKKQTQQMADFAAVETAKRAEEEIEKSEVERQKAEEEVLLRAQVEGKEAEVVVTTPSEVQYVKEWESQPMPDVWLTACRDALPKVTASVLGWSLSTMNCTLGQLSASWVRIEERLGKKAVAPKGALLDLAGRSMNSSVPLEGTFARGASTEPLWEPQRVTEFFLAKGWSFTAERIPDPVPQQEPLVGGLLPTARTAPPKEAPPPPPWIKVRITITTKEAPWGIMGDLASIPGMTLTNLAWSGASLWTLDGVVYEKR